MLPLAAQKPEQQPRDRTPSRCFSLSLLTCFSLSLLRCFSLSLLNMFLAGIRKVQADARRTKKKIVCLEGSSEAAARQMCAKTDLSHVQKVVGDTFFGTRRKRRWRRRMAYVRSFEVGAMCGTAMRAVLLGLLAATKPGPFHTVHCHSSK